jgi:hypothetical protein
MIHFRRMHDCYIAKYIGGRTLLRSSEGVDTSDPYNDSVIVGA